MLISREASFAIHRPLAITVEAIVDIHRPLAIIIRVKSNRPLAIPADANVAIQ